MRKFLLILVLFYTPIFAENPSDSNTQSIAQNITINAEDSTMKNPTNLESKQDKTQEKKDTPQNDIKAESQSEKKEDFFEPARISGEGFGTFAVGYQSFHKKQDSKFTQKSGIFFAIERGWLVYEDILLLSLTLDGSAGEFYSVNGNLKFGVRTLDGRLIPSVSVGYGMFNNAINNEQYNTHGANATISLFVDIGHGFGIEGAYRVGLHPFFNSKSGVSRVKEIHSFIVNLRFVDFSF